MRWGLLMLLVFLAGCGSPAVMERAGTEDVDAQIEETIEEEQPEEAFEEPEEETALEHESYELDARHQEGGIRLNVLRVEEVPSKREIMFTIVVEEIIGNEENRDPFKWFGNLFSNGKIVSLYQCGVERLDENRWHASYCEKFSVLPDDIFEERTYFVFTRIVKDKLEGRFIRELDQQPDTITVEIDLKDKFAEQLKEK